MKNKKLPNPLDLYDPLFDHAEEAISGSLSITEKESKVDKSVLSKLKKIEPKLEDFEDEESYLEARDGFRHRVGHLLKPKR